MNIDIDVAKTIIQIKSGTLLTANNKLIGIIPELDLYQKIDICNAVVLSHKHRFDAAYTEEQRDNEVAALVHNYELLFAESLSGFIKTDMLVLLFRLISLRNYSSVEFPEVCFEIFQKYDSCDSEDIKRSVLMKIISVILRMSLYGKDPHDSILEQCVERLGGLSQTDNDVKNIRFME